MAESAAGHRRLSGGCWRELRHEKLNREGRRSAARAPMGGHTLLVIGAPPHSVDAAHLQYCTALSLWRCATRMTDEPLMPGFNRWVKT
jgi:hypothetical protein